MCRVGVSLEGLVVIHLSEPLDFHDLEVCYLSMKLFKPLYFKSL